MRASRTRHAWAAVGALALALSASAMPRLDATGIADCAAPINAALAAGERELHFPAGEYRLDRPLSLPSGTRLVADAGAHFFASPANEPEAIVSNADWEGGNADILVSGGVWDGLAPYHPRKGWNDPRYPAGLFKFVNVRRLVLENLVVTDGVCYQIALSRTRDFRVENIRFEGTFPVKCQDGVHLWGGCEDGLIRGIRCRFYATGDDLIAINADDVGKYAHNKGGVDGPIRRITVEDVFAPCCHSVIRLLSVRSPIRDVVLRNIRGGYREFGINMDAARYCADPMFDTAAETNGVGHLENVLFENVELWYAGDSGKAKEVVNFETNAKNVRFRGFRHAREREHPTTRPHATFRFRNLAPTTVDFGDRKAEAGAENLEFSGTDYRTVNVNSKEATR